MTKTRTETAPKLESKTPPKMYKSRYSDENQDELPKKFAPNSFLGNPRNCDHVLRWNTFFRRNLHRFAIDYLGINLYPYQAIAMYLMGISQSIVIIACRAAAKSFLIALYACCRCILYPNSQIVLSSSTKGQSKLIVSEKIQGELMNISPMLRQEILSIKDNQNEVIVKFRSGSRIIVVPASENGRGHRSNVCIREECRQIDKYIDDSILSPFQTVRTAQFMLNPYYAGIEELKEEPVDVYISSSWLDPHWMWNIADTAYESMLEGKGGCLLAFDESVTLKHNIRTQKQMQKEKKKQDPITWQVEFLNVRLKENTAAFFTYQMFLSNQRIKKPFYPRTAAEAMAGRKNQYDIPRLPNEVRIVACDMAFVENEMNDNSIFTCMRLIPEYENHVRDGETVETGSGYRRAVVYMESVQGGDTVRQAKRIRELYEDFGADYIVLDTRNAGVATYDMLAREMYDDDRNVYYSPLCCMNNDGIAGRVRIPGAKPCIFAVNATQKLNSDIALDFRRVLLEKKIDFLISYDNAKDEILSRMKEYTAAPSGEEQAFYEAPYLETQSLIGESASLIYEKKQDTGIIAIREQGNNRKDRYTSVSYGNYFATLMERENMSAGEEMEFGVFIN